MKKNSTVLILLGAGNGSRFSKLDAKQYAIISGKSIFEESILSVLKNQNINYVLPVISESHITKYNSLKLANPKLLPFVLGGKERFHSVINALRSLKKLNPQKVLIHDCARVCTPSKIISNVVESITYGIGVVPSLPVVDSLKFVSDGFIKRDTQRDNLYSVQTPQGFIYSEILDSYENFINEILTDDSSYYIKNGFSVKVIEGSEFSKKITYKTDLEILQKMTRDTEVRIGMGQDIHQFTDIAEKKDLYLCGVKIPHNKGLKAHSDGDVVLHSLVDAILGALALGDIGDYFPPSEEQWKNQPSSIFLKFANQKLLELSGKIINIDITILAEEPKISKHKEAMKHFLSEILDIELTRLNIKATTMEKMGSIGRSEGIFASSVISIELPTKIKE
jgi:2-C-methyl-D-erythritol 4-phosphate cytidylyltransferase/2-C-methyl-D-erythritol 2,4-cyclodiphosphate synthase